MSVGDSRYDESLGMLPNMSTPEELECVKVCRVGYVR